MIFELNTVFTVTMKNKKQKGKIKMTAFFDSLLGFDLAVFEWVQSIQSHFLTAIMTTVTTLIAVVSVYIVAMVFSLDSVTGFALPMMVGLISGCYSSICIAGPLWVLWQKRKAAKAKKR